MIIADELKQKLKSIKLLALDFDGTLTVNAWVIFDQNGVESVICSRRDSLGLDMLQQAGIKAVVISKETNPVVVARCRKMNVECFHGVDTASDKQVILREYAEKFGFLPAEVAFMGDDINDIPAMKYAAVGLTVSDGHPQVKVAADYVTAAAGGSGAVREVCELILAARGVVKNIQNLTINIKNMNSFETRGSKVIKIGTREVGGENSPFIIAEVGINHNGSVELAKKLIDVAVEVGVDAVKFQKRTIPVVYSASDLAKPRAVDRGILENAVKRGVLDEAARERLLSSDFNNATNSDLKWALEFTFSEYQQIDDYCREKGIMWFASCWDPESVEFIEKFNPPCHKIASASLTDAELLSRIVATGRPVILSTGMSTMEEVGRAVNMVGRDNLVLLHAISTYPAKNEELNLKVMETLKSVYPDVVIGYSGHEVSPMPSIMAAALGAAVIERHITLDRTMWGSDQAASLEPKGLEILVKNARLWSQVKGDGIKRVYESELPIRDKLRRK